MGTWGDGLYATDFAADLRERVAEHLRLPFEPAEVLALLCAEAGIAPDAPPQKADAVAFWLVCADQFHRHGVVLPGLTARAVALIEDGTDRALNAARGMGEPELRRRGRALAALRVKWAAPPARPAKRQLLAPEPLPLVPGEMHAYPMRNGNRRPLSAARDPGWAPDAWGAFLVLAAGHAFHGMKARTLVAPLTCFRPLHAKPGVEDGPEAQFLIECSFARRSFRPLCGWTDWDRAELAAIGAEQVGRFALDLAALEAVFPDLGQAPPETPSGALDPLVLWFGPQSARARGWSWGAPLDTLAQYARPLT